MSKLIMKSTIIKSENSLCYPLKILRFCSIKYIGFFFLITIIAQALSCWLTPLYFRSIVVKKVVLMCFREHIYWLPCGFCDLFYFLIFCSYKWTRLIGDRIYYSCRMPCFIFVIINMNGLNIILVLTLRWNNVNAPKLCFLERNTVRNVER